MSATTQPPNREFGCGFGSGGVRYAQAADGGQPDEESEEKQSFADTTGQTQRSPQLSPGLVIIDIYHHTSHSRTSTDHLPSPNLTEDHPDEAIHSGTSLAQRVLMAPISIVMKE